MSDNPCKWHEVPVKDCLTCNNTPSNIYYILDDYQIEPVELTEKEKKERILKVDLKLNYISVENKIDED